MTAARVEPDVEPHPFMDSATVIVAPNLDRLLAAAVVFASQDLTLPVLAAVHLRRDGTSLTATATDRYSLYRETIEVNEDSAPGDWTFLLGGDDLHTLRQLIGCVTRGRVASTRKLITVRLTHEAPADLPATLVAEVGPLRAQFDPRGEQFPDLDKLIEEQPEKGAGIFDVDINPRLLARISKVDSSTTPWSFTQAAPNRPVYATPVTPDHKAVVMIMPMRRPTP